MVVTVLALALIGVGASSGSASARTERFAATVPVPASGSPIGSLDGISPSFDNLWTVRGWAADPDATATLNIHIYVGSTPVKIAVVDKPRPDVAAAVPWAGGSAGFEQGINFRGSLQQYGSDNLCAYTYNQNRGSSTLLGCRHLNGPAPASRYNPMGHVDAAVPAQGLLRLVGWAGDPDGTGFTHVRVYDNGFPLTQLNAFRSRPDVRAATGLGLGTGYDETIPMYPGPHTVCLYAENTGNGTSNLTLGCVSRNEPGPRYPGLHDPRGSFDSLTRGPCCTPQTLAAYPARGWAFDPDSAAAPVQIVLRNWSVPNIPQNGVREVSTTTSIARPDVQAALGAGPNTGFAIDGSASFPGYVVVCVWAKNVGPGTDRFLGCRWSSWS